MVEPYFQDSDVTLYHGKVDDVLPHIGGGYDLVVTSPPYNLDGATGTYFSNLKDGYADHSDAMPYAEYQAWQRLLLSRLWSDLPDGGAIFYNHKPRVSGGPVLLPNALIPPDVPVRQIIIWDRGSGHNRQFTYYVPSHEYVFLLAKEGFRTNTKSVDDVWRIPFETNSAHPAPFPLSLATRAIGTTDASVILDPFAGSGTTLRAAKDLGRKAIGIEMSERYCEMIVKRLAQGTLDFG